MAHKGLKPARQSQNGGFAKFKSLDTIVSRFSAPIDPNKASYEWRPVS